MSSIDAITMMIAGSAFSTTIIQVIVVLTVIGIFVLWGKYKLGILVSYFYCLYWTFVTQRMILEEVFVDDRMSLFVFVFMGFSVAVLGIFSLFNENGP